MKKFLIIPLLFLSVTAMAACSPSDTPETGTEQPANPEQPGGEDAPDEPDSPDEPVRTKTLVAYFSAQGHTQAVAERIAEVLGADIFRIFLSVRPAGGISRLWWSALFSNRMI